MASTSSQTPAPPDPATMNMIRQRLLETGDWDRLLRSLRARLEEAGWEDDVKDFAKADHTEKARSQEVPNLEALLQEVTPKASAMLQPKIREALIQEIEAVLEREVESA